MRLWSLSLSPAHMWQPPGPPVAERIFMLSPGFDISVDQSNISQVFSTGYWNALVWLRGPRCRETLAWGGPCRGTRRMSRRSS